MKESTTHIIPTMFIDGVMSIRNHSSISAKEDADTTNISSMPF